MNDDERQDLLAEIADRWLERYGRGDDPGLEEELDWGGLTELERGQLMDLIEQRRLAREERLEAAEAEVRALEAVADLVPSGATLGEALTAGDVTPEQVITAIRNAG